MMKKLFTILLLTMLMLNMAACSGSGNSGSGEPSASEEPAAPVTIADDLDVMAMHFTRPESYSEVSRTSILDRDNGLHEKDIIYTLEDGTEITFAYTPNEQLSDYIDLDTLETLEADGQTGYIYGYSGGKLVFFQLNGDLYAVDISPYDEGSDLLEKTAEGITFTDKNDTLVDDMTIDHIRYTTVNEEDICGYVITAAEDSDGEPTEKSLALYYGTDVDDPEYRLAVRRYVGRTLDNILLADNEYGTAEVNDIEYTTYSGSEEEPYVYYYAFGDDVFVLRNNGKSGFLGATRSEESFQALKALVESASFE